MTMSVNTNLSAINAYNNLNATSNQMNSTVAELSSGLQIQTAAQDASGYVISQGLNVESSGLGQAIQNGQNGVSVLQIAEGAMNQQVGARAADNAEEIDIGNQARDNDRRRRERGNALEAGTRHRCRNGNLGDRFHALPSTLLLMDVAGTVLRFVFRHHKCQRVRYDAEFDRQRAARLAVEFEVDGFAGIGLAGYQPRLEEMDVALAPEP